MRPCTHSSLCSNRSDRPPPAGQQVAVGQPGWVGGGSEGHGEAEVQGEKKQRLKWGGGESGLLEEAQRKAALEKTPPTGRDGGRGKYAGKEEEEEEKRHSLHQRTGFHPVPFRGGIDHRKACRGFSPAGESRAPGRRGHGLTAPRQLSGAREGTGKLRPRMARAWRRGQHPPKRQFQQPPPRPHEASRSPWRQSRKEAKRPPCACLAAIARDRPPDCPRENTGPPRGCPAAQPAPASPVAACTRLGRTPARNQPREARREVPKAPLAVWWRGALQRGLVPEGCLAQEAQGAERKKLA